MEQKQQQQVGQRPNGSRLLQYAAAFSATLGYVTFGAFLGWGAPVLPRLTSNSSHIPTTEDEASWIIASSSLSMVLPMLVFGHLVDIFGRKRMLLFTVGPHVALWLIQIFATRPWELVLSRVIGAIAQCIVLVATPCYLTEIAELEIRGTLMTMYQVMQNLGTLVVFCVAPYVHFRTLAGVLLTFPLLLLATLPWMPESPAYLLLRERYKEAQEALVRLRGVDSFEDVAEELAAMRRAVEERMGGAVSVGYMATLRELLVDPVNRRTLLLASALQALLLWCGFLVMMTYATFFFKLSGSTLDPDLCSIALAIIQLAMSVVASVAVERFRTRKTPLMVCFSGACVALVAEGFYFFVKDGLHGDVSSIGWLPLTAHIVFLIFNTMGPGALIWTVCGEVFRPRVKSLAMSVLSVVNCSSAFATLKVYHLMYTYWDLYVPFWVFAGFCLLGMLFVWRQVPETKGRHPEEVALEIAGRRLAQPVEVPATEEEMEKMKV